MEMKHFSHDHPLNLLENIIDDDLHDTIISFSCCDKRYSPPSDDQVYGCRDCRYFIHQSCSQIPSEIHHFYHPGHVLKLLAPQVLSSKNPVCVACYKSYAGFTYQCEKHSYFNMDVECALLPTKLKQEDCLEHLTHGHPLMLCDGNNNEVKGKLCSGCKKPCLGKINIYGCWLCDYFLDESCTMLPQQIEEHPFHPSHPLILKFSSSMFTCNACEHECADGFRYTCSSSCRVFSLDLNCVLLTPTIQFEDHDHPLTLFKKVNKNLYCSLCGKKCRDDPPMAMRCVDCDYNLHLHCGPLPRTINDKCHADPLKLMNYFVEDGYQADDIYCDACENKRDPEECVYCCKDCNFVSEIKCVMPEVLARLEGRHGNVKLRSAGKTKSWIGGRVLTHLSGKDQIDGNIECESDTEIQEIRSKYLEVKVDRNPLDSNPTFTIEEVDQIIQIFANARVTVPDFVSERALTEEQQQTMRLGFSQYAEQYEQVETYKEALDIDENASDENFKRFIIKLDSYHLWWDFFNIFTTDDLNVVMIGDLMVVKELAGILKGLFSKYGDFTSKSKLNPKLKMLFSTVFCEVVREMCVINVREVGFNLLQEWWKSLKLVKYAGFEIQFVIDHLYKVAQASFELRNEGDIATLEWENDRNLREQKRLVEELETYKRDQEVIQSKLSRCKILGNQRSSSIRERLRYASDFKWKKAWEDTSPIMFTSMF